MKHLISFSSLLVLASIVTGCATLSGAESNKNLAKLKYGMSQSQVLNLLGTPDSVIRPNQVDDKWVYEFKKQEKRGHNVYVEFKNGSLTKTGELSGREIAAADEFRKPGMCNRRIRAEMMQEPVCLK